MKSPLPGKVLDILVKEGETVKEDQALIIIESMKMENEICTEKDGLVKKVLVNIGDLVKIGDELIELEDL